MRVEISVSRSCDTKRNGNSLDKLRHPRSDAYSAAEQVLLNKQQICCRGAYRDCYQRNRNEGH